ncbi:hypothetical protein ACJX0J_034032, partial [Zea mays]
IETHIYKTKLDVYALIKNKKLEVIILDVFKFFDKHLHGNYYKKIYPITSNFQKHIFYGKKPNYKEEIVDNQLTFSINVLDTNCFKKHFILAHKGKNS